MKIFKYNLVWYLVSIGISLFCFYLLYRLITPNIDTLFAARKDFRVGPVLLTIPVYYAGLYAASIVWGKMMNDLTRPLAMRQHQVIYIVTHAARRVPGTVWHVLGRIAWYERLGIRKGITAFANGLETVLIILSGLVMVAIFFPFLTNSSGVKLWQILLGIGTGLLVIHPRLIQVIMARLGQEAPPGKITYRLIISWFIYYLAIWLTGGSVLFLILRSMLDVSLALWPVCIVAWCTAGVAGMLLIFLPSGLGLNEATISLLLAIHIPSSIAVAAAIIIRILLTLYEFAIAAILLVIRNRIDLPYLPPSESNQSEH